MAQRVEEASMKVVYIAGKFRGTNAWEVHQNVQEALKVGFEVAALGAMPLIPHSNTQPFDGTLQDQFWLDGTLELLRRCDAVMTVPNWVRSKGAKAEVDEAKDELGIPVFHALDELTEWLVESEKQKGPVIHVSVFIDDADGVPPVMMCGRVISMDDDGCISDVGHDFYGMETFKEKFASMGGYSVSGRLTEVSCPTCHLRLSRVIAARGSVGT